MSPETAQECVCARERGSGSIAHTPAHGEGSPAKGLVISRPQNLGKADDNSRASLRCLEQTVEGLNLPWGSLALGCGWRGDVALVVQAADRDLGWGVRETIEAMRSVKGLELWMR